MNVVKNQTKTLSIIIEWENILLAKDVRAVRMLKELSKQIQELKNIDQSAAFTAEQKSFLKQFQFPLEVMIVFDVNDIEQSEIEQIVRECVSNNHDINLRFLPVNNLRYYAYKNFGAKKTTADYVLFLDSDVIPDEFWFGHLLSSIQNPDVHTVAGNTYIETKSLYGKIFALGWFFELRADHGELKKVRAVMSNNLIYKREQFLQYKYPDEPGISRGACSRLADQFQKDNLNMYINYAAQVGHPPPNGLYHFCVRAIAEGRDYMVPITQQKPGRLWLVRLATRRVWTQLKRSLKRIVQQYKQVDLPIIAVPLAIVVMCVYYFIYYIGEIFTAFNPAFMKKHFQV